MGTRTDTIQQEIDETREAITEKMETIEAKVQYATDEVRDSVSNTVDNIKERFNVDQMVQERPWAMLGASIIAGYMLGSFGGSSQSDDRYENHSRGYRSYEDDDNDDDTYYRGRPYRYYTAETMQRSRSGSRSKRSSAIMNELSNQMGKEMDTLKEATIVTITKTLRSALRETVPQLADEFERARAEREQQHQEDNSSATNMQNTTNTHV